MIPVGKTAAALLLAAAAIIARADTSAPAGDAALCLGCHDFGPDSPVHQVQAGSHGTSDNPEEMLGRRGCQDCHGDSDPDPNSDPNAHADPHTYPDSHTN